MTRLTRDSIKLPFWSLSVSETAEALGVAVANGLSADVVSERAVVFGKNVFEENGKLRPFRAFLRQFASPLILILFAAGIVTLFLKEWIDAVVIFAALSANTALGFYQEYTSETVLARLQTYIRIRARVLRGGKEIEIDAENLVPGDVMFISQGDRIPADARIIRAAACEVDEAILTGESQPEQKTNEPVSADTPLGDRVSMLYGGTLAVGGFAHAVVTATGKNTEFGTIAALVRNEGESKTPLQKSILRLSIIIGGAALVLVAALFAIGLSAGYAVFDMFLIAVAVAVSAVPEGLPVALTIILAVGVERLARKKAIVRRLLAAETLGVTSLILTDKTGTLTTSSMELVDVMPWGTDTSDKGVVSSSLTVINAFVENPSDAAGAWRINGRPMETGLVRGAAKLGILYPEVMKKHTVTDRLPFSSAHKFSAAVSVTDGHARAVVLGAPDIVSEFADMTAEERSHLHAVIDERASRGERLLGVMSKDLPSREYTFSKSKKEAFSSFVFEGILAFRDPIRPGVKKAVERIRASGVKTAVVTGDHAGTARAVALDVGIADKKTHAVLTGNDMRLLSSEELFNRAGEVRVFARVSPEDKLRLVDIYKKRGEIVAVTGDGVNDAPALKRADIGVAVGSGTDVAKDAADLVILDDNFETLVFAIEEGRRILHTIRKVVVYVLSNALDEIFLIGGSLLLGLPLPLNALQILFVNFFSDSFPALAFAFETSADDPAHARAMRPGLFNAEIKILIAGIGIASSFFLFALYWILLARGFPEDVVKSFIFVSFASYTLVLSFSLRNLERLLATYNPFSNRFLNAGVGFGLVLTFASVYVPFFRDLLGTVPLPLPWLLGIIAVWIANIAAVESVKWFFSIRNEKRARNT